MSNENVSNDSCNRSFDKNLLSTCSLKSASNNSSVLGTIATALKIRCKYWSDAKSTASSVFVVGATNACIFGGFGAHW